MRSLTTFALTFAALLGVGVAGLSQGLLAFWVGLGATVACVLWLCFLEESDG
jgi:hypothetical protein